MHTACRLFVFVYFSVHQHVSACDSGCDLYSEEEEIQSDEEEQEAGQEVGVSVAPGGEAGPPKRKLDMAEYPEFMAKRFAAFQPYRNTTLQSWQYKTRLTVGKGAKVRTHTLTHTHM